MQYGHAWLDFSAWLLGLPLVRASEVGTSQEIRACATVRAMGPRRATLTAGRVAGYLCRASLVAREVKGWRVENTLVRLHLRLARPYAQVESPAEHCTTTDWLEWSSCTETCGSGQQERSAATPQAWPVLNLCGGTHLAAQSLSCTRCSTCRAGGDKAIAQVVTMAVVVSVCPR